jgi:hypothetical protein
MDAQGKGIAQDDSHPVIEYLMPSWQDGVEEQGVEEGYSKGNLGTQHINWEKYYTQS